MSRLLAALAGACCLAVLASCVYWIVENPLPAYFDEALYVSQATVDDYVLSTRGIGGLAEVLLHLDGSRPPAYRLFAVPLLAFTAPSTHLLRLLSILELLTAAVVLGLAVRRMSGSDAGALTILLILGSPVLILSARMFGTEGPLILAISGLVASLVTRKDRWLLLGLSIGCGLLSKASFPLVAAPMLTAAFMVAPRSATTADRPTIIKGLLLGLAIGSVWWFPNASSAIAKGIRSGSFVRHSLGPWDDPATAVRWLYELLRTVTGFAAAVAVALILSATFRRAMRDPRAPGIVIVLWGALLVPFVTYTSSNHNPRLLATIVPLLAVAVGIASSMIDRRILTFLALAVAAQVLVMVLPRQWSEADENRSYIWRGSTEIMAPVQQWDWSPLRDLSRSIGLKNPLINMVGEAYQMNQPAITLPWTRAHEGARVRPFAKNALSADLVVTLPSSFRGDPRDGQPPLNAENEALVRSLRTDLRFLGPIQLDIGHKRPFHAIVFIRR